MSLLSDASRVCLRLYCRPCPRHNLGISWFRARLRGCRELTHRGPVVPPAVVMPLPKPHSCVLLCASQSPKDASLPYLAPVLLQPNSKLKLSLRQFDGRLCAIVLFLRHVPALRMDASLWALSFRLSRSRVAGIACVGGLLQIKLRSLDSNLNS